MEEERKAFKRYREIPMNRMETENRKLLPLIRFQMENKKYCAENKQTLAEKILLSQTWLILDFGRRRHKITFRPIEHSHECSLLQ